jgi:hypothetical protein
MRTQIDASETLTHATELGFRNFLALRARLYMGDVCVQQVLKKLNGSKVRYTRTLFTIYAHKCQK